MASGSASAKKTLRWNEPLAVEVTAASDALDLAALLEANGARSATGPSDQASADG